MSVPIIHVDMAKVARQVEVDCRCDPSVGILRRMESEARFEERWKQWLSQYDDRGYIKPGVRQSPDYIPNMSVGFLDMSVDERAAYIVEEKRRMGLL